jgi:hypothetical protein
MLEQNNSIGDVMSEGKTSALKSLAMLAGIIVYLGMIGYSAVHNIALLTAGIAPDMVAWALVGVVSLELSAVALPIALHYWTHAPMQRIAAFGFYGLDLIIVMFNVLVDYAVKTGAGAALPEWLIAYKFYLLPVGPIVCGLGWSLIWLLDPSQKERAMLETLRASTREVLSKRIAEQAKAADVSELVDNAAYNLARGVVATTLGASVTKPRGLLSGNGHKQPAEIVRAYDAIAEVTVESPNGKGGAL